MSITSQLVRYRAVIEYDGTDFHGYQRQRAGIRTVQGELENALHRIRQRPVTVLASGRTDSGVHATGQVVAFDIEWSHGQASLLKALNANLPADVAVSQIEVAHGRFHPRFDARRRAYEYLIEDCSRTQTPRPLTRLRHWQVYRPLNIAAMNAAAEHLLGEKDFATFGTPPQGDNTVRRIFCADWNSDGRLFRFRIEATAFLYRMVRSIVGSLKQVGDGQWTVEQFARAVKSAQRDQSAAAAPAHGLYLVSVSYHDIDNE